MKKITELNQVDTSLPEGKLLLAALAKLTTGSESDKTPDEVLKQVNDLAEKMYDEVPKIQEFPQVYTVNFMDVVDPSGDENMKAFNEFCVKCHADKNTKNLPTGHLAVLWHFATGKGVYEPAGTVGNKAV